MQANCQAVIQILLVRFARPLGRQCCVSDISCGPACAPDVQRTKQDMDLDRLPTWLPEGAAALVLRAGPAGVSTALPAPPDVDASAGAAVAAAACPGAFSALAAGLPVACAQGCGSPGCYGCHSMHGDWQLGCCWSWLPATASHRCNGMHLLPRDAQLGMRTCCCSWKACMKLPSLANLFMAWAAACSASLSSALPLLSGFGFLCTEPVNHHCRPVHAV